MCAGVLGLAASAVYAFLPRRFRRGRTVVPLAATVIGGLYGAVILICAAFGEIHGTSARLAPANGDLLSVSIGFAGTGRLLGAFFGLLARFVWRRDVAPQDWTERVGLLGLLLGLLLWVLVPGLNS